MDISGINGFNTILQYTDFQHDKLNFNDIKAKISEIYSVTLSVIEKEADALLKEKHLIFINYINDFNEYLNCVEKGEIPINTEVFKTIEEKIDLMLPIMRQLETRKKLERLENKISELRSKIDSAKTIDFNPESIENYNIILQGMDEDNKSIKEILGNFISNDYLQKINEMIDLKYDSISNIEIELNDKLNSLSVYKTAENIYGNGIKFPTLTEEIMAPQKIVSEQITNEMNEDFAARLRNQGFLKQNASFEYNDENINIQSKKRLKIIVNNDDAMITENNDILININDFVPTANKFA